MAEHESLASVRLSPEEVRVINEDGQAIRRAIDRAKEIERLHPERSYRRLREALRREFLTADI